jgi:hypothetical protein
MPDGADLSDACSRLFDEPGGSVAPGGICTTNADCAGSPGTVTQCSVYSTCVTYAVGALGDYPCLGNEDSEGLISASPLLNNAIVSQGFLCQERAGLFCDDLDYHCKMRQPSGSVCTYSEACDSGTCDDNSGTTTGTLPRAWQPRQRLFVGLRG